MKIKTRIFALVLSVSLLLCSCTNHSAVNADMDSWNTNYKYIFVHGLSGWGSYDTTNKFLKYWGMFGGDLLEKLNEQGYDCYAASVNPQGSAWDRACELYAQLTGNVVDYGKEHSARCNHERFGTDYTGNALIDEWDATNKVNLIGHSFGGATVRMLADLLADGSDAEKNATDENDLSGLFTGGKEDWIYSIVTLAAPHNGTTAYNADDDAEEEISGMQKIMSDMVSKFTTIEKDGRADYDYASYDMFIDNALALNEELQTLQNIYYFSYPCSSTIKNDDGTYSPDEDITETTFIKSAIKMGKFQGTTEGGYVIDESWFENDGLVNTMSATAPFKAPSTEFDESNIAKGEWNIMPVYTGDHMSLQGGLFKKNDVKGFYLDLLNMINSL